jgi:putative thioredoxin
VQGIPAVFAVVAGQPIPLFQGAAPEPQLRQVLEQLVQAAEQQFGIVGAPAGGSADEDGEEPEEQPEPAGPYDRVLEAAGDALDQGDLGGAIQAYENVLADDPGNAEAKLGLAQAELLRRVQGLDAQQVRKSAADDPADVRAQIAAADLDLVGGHVDDAFGRLVEAVRRTAGDDRQAARVRLLELFEVIGPEDQRVVKARGALARVLF